MLLLLEAVAEDERPPSWQYAFARATSGGLEAQLDGKLVWKVEQLLDDPLARELVWGDAPMAQNRGG